MSGSDLAKPGLVIQAAVRFAAIYFTLLFFPWPIFGLLVSDRLKQLSEFLVSEVAHAWKPLVDFAAASVFQIGHPVVVVFTDTGSSDRLFDWLVDFWVLVFSAAIATVWTVIKKRDGGWTEAYLRAYLRYTLGAVMLTYGSLKLSQFPPPYFSVLNKTIGEETPMGLLWAFIGASTGYTACIGLLEVLCGGLLLFRRTTLLGSCLGFALTLNIFLLNMFYDVPVKLFSFNLLLAALTLLGPDLGRLARMFVLNQPVSARTYSYPTRSRVQNVAWLTLKTLFIVALVGGDVVAVVEGYGKRTTPKVSIEGIWRVDSVLQGGKDVSDSAQGKAVRWQWLTIDRLGSRTTGRVWLADGSEGSGLVTGKTEPVLTLPGPHKPQSWTLQLGGKDGLEVRGVASAASTSMRLHRDQAWISLAHHDIHWIQDAPTEP